MSIVSEVSEKPAIRSRPGPTSRRGRRKTGTNTGTGPLGWFLLVVLAVYAGGPLVVFLFNSLKSPAEISNSRSARRPSGAGRTSSRRSRTPTWARAS